MIEIRKRSGYDAGTVKDKVMYYGWRPELAHADRRKLANAKEPKEKRVIPAIRFFDQLSWIGDEGVGCFVLETLEGLILLDCMRPNETTKTIIEQGMSDLGLDIHDVKAVIISHGHFDHFGIAGYLHETYGCNIYLSERDYQEAQNPPVERLKHFFTEYPFTCTAFLEDGDVFRMGDTEIYVIGTPGHSPGCNSFVFKVTDEGREHWVGMWGGTGITGRDLKDREQYLLSLIKFSEITRKFGCDVEIASHPFVDNSIERLEICRNIVVGTAHPFVIGKEAFQRFLTGYATLCHD